ncbi:MAG: sensor histidine kinase KdpD [Actinomycetales bacterium]|nr:sensor histidine kinase KdpD [Actinomycetales bacterium]
MSDTAPAPTDPRARTRGTLRVFLGAAPGVGKTYAMLDEAHRRAERGADVVVGLVETHGRAATAAQLEGLEVLPRTTLTHRGAMFTELDVDAVLARHPQVVLIDELAHTNVPGSRHAKRWQDVEQVLDAGIDVVTTVNVQHLESLNDVVTSITGIRQQETVPDEVVRRADQIELVDMSPEALRRRLAHGNVYAPEKVDAALTQYFRVGNLTALRELALLWTADRVDDALERYRQTHDIHEPWPARERVVVAVTGGPESGTLLRRGARIAQRGTGGELIALHVARSDGLAGTPAADLTTHRTLAEELGGTWHSVVGDDVAAAILEFARGVNANQIVLGATHRTRIAAALSEGIGAKVVRGSGEIDVHIVSHEAAGGRGPRPHPRRALSTRRLAGAWVLAVVGPPALAALLVRITDTDALPTVLMLYLALTTAVALLGGMFPALVAAVLGGLVSNYFFVPPVGTWTIAAPQNVVALVVLVAVAVAVSVVVDQAARRSSEAARARAEAATLTTMAGSILRGRDAVPAMLDQLRETFGVESAAIFQRDADRWRCLAGSGTAAPSVDVTIECGPLGELPDEPGLTTIGVNDDLILRLSGTTLSATDLRIATAVGAQAEAVIERDRLREEAKRARAERERGATRTALLAAVSHDLRTPLAAIKAGVTALTRGGAPIAPEDQAALLGDVEQSTDRLQALIDNLLDMSRIDAGAVAARPMTVGLDEIIPGALASVPLGAVIAHVEPELPLLHVDPGLVERALANVVENAVHHGAATGHAVELHAERTVDSVLIRVVDRGRGVPAAQKEAVFGAFQRLGDAPAGRGVGLGLAVARGLIEANQGTIEAEDTPGGGLTMAIRLPLAQEGG